MVFNQQKKLFKLKLWKSFKWKTSYLKMAEILFCNPFFFTKLGDLWDAGVTNTNSSHQELRDHKRPHVRTTLEKWVFHLKFHTVYMENERKDPHFQFIVLFWKTRKLNHHYIDGSFSTILSKTVCSAYLAYCGCCRWLPWGPRRDFLQLCLH